VFGPFLLRGVVDIILATVTLLPVALVGLVAYGLGTPTGAITFNSLLQADAPAATRGRIFAGLTFSGNWVGSPPSCSAGSLQPSSGYGASTTSVGQADSGSRHRLARESGGL